MSKLQSSFPNMALSLITITMISAAALGFVFELTKVPIADSQRERQLKAIRIVTPAFDNSPAREQSLVATSNGDSLIIYPAKRAGNLVGVAVESTTNKGFSGQIKIMVGFNSDGTIRNYFVLQHAETPGLGSKMQEWFRDSVTASRSVLGLNPVKILKVKKDGGCVDAITAATISSRAFLDAINRAYSAYRNYASALTSDNNLKTEMEAGK